MQRLLCRKSCLIALLGGLLAEPLRGEPRIPAPPRRVVELIERLGDDSYFVREAASRELRSIGEPILSHLRDAADNWGDFEIRSRAEHLVRLILYDSRHSRTLGLEMVLLDPGAFRMGSTATETGRRSDENEHTVSLSRHFLLGVHEVTQHQYREVMKTNPSAFSRTGESRGKVTDLDTRHFPVENVTWFDAIDFCNRLSRLDGYEPYYHLSEARRENGSLITALVELNGGNGYRLPTEAEWEYACRGGTATRFHFGDMAGARSGNFKVTVGGGYASSPRDVQLGRTAEVGSYKPNDFGLYDMHGNVAEWCWDWYGEEYYAVSPPRDPAGPETGQRRVLRGGSWLGGDAAARSACRFAQSPDMAKYFAGFRVARTP